MTRTANAALTIFASLLAMAAFSFGALSLSAAGHAAQVAAVETISA